MAKCVKKQVKESKNKTMKRVVELTTYELGGVQADELVKSSVLKKLNDAIGETDVVCVCLFVKKREALVNISHRTKRDHDNKKILIKSDNGEIAKKVASVFEIGD
jgi:hypothetical protein